jgi:hypothetical protein
MSTTFDLDRPLLLDGGTGIDLLKRRVPILTPSQPCQINIVLRVNAGIGRGIRVSPRGDVMAGRISIP